MSRVPLATVVLGCLHLPRAIVALMVAERPPLPVKTPQLEGPPDLMPRVVPPGAKVAATASKALVVFSLIATNTFGGTPYTAGASYGSGSEVAAESWSRKWSTLQA